ncbi:PREDICTED: mitochondrial import receptor subunit TOM40 homolog 1-like [Rhagoletis zephyria]|uniref:mitochondrial import receptor subunit TOM40 homolog 1-like n=1 Tax=Rhagoletis zephyria TaxID=28612 RepID=UPI0008118FE8|nr:PREDICTED: mitochondrial import receptor subunit TOM40 homolog 1-like [Rhagoletis zephyria]
MGNVLATSAPSPPLPGGQSFSQFLPPENPSGGDASPKDALSSQPETNPGTMEELHRKCKDIFPMPFDGAKVVINKMLSNHFQISHNIIMSGGINPPGYRFGATYIGTRQLSPSEAYPIFFGEIDPTGNVSSRIIHQLGERTKVQVTAQFQNSKCVMGQLTTDYNGPFYTGSLVLGNVDPINASGIAVASYLQNVTKSLSLGAELVTQYNSPQVNSVLSIAGRYTSPSDFIVSGTLNKSGVQLCYYQKKNENLQHTVALGKPLHTKPPNEPFKCTIILNFDSVVTEASNQQQQQT